MISQRLGAFFQSGCPDLPLEKIVAAGSATELPRDPRLTGGEAPVPVAGAFYRPV
jgi:hypothetical protein